MPYKKSVVSNIYSFPFRDHVVDKLLVPLVDTGSNFSPKKCRISLLPPVRCSAHCRIAHICELFPFSESMLHLLALFFVTKPVDSLSCLQCAAVPNYPTVCPDDGVLDQLDVSSQKFSPVFVSVSVFVKSQNHIQILFQILIWDWILVE